MSPPSSASPPRLTLATFLPYRLNVLATIVSEGLARVYGERFGIGIPEWRVLATVGEFGDITATAVGQHARMGKVKVSRAVTNLAEAGLILRQASTRDRREALLALTPKGSTVYAELVPLAEAYARELTAGLTREEAATLDRVIGTLLAQAGTINRWV